MSKQFKIAIIAIVVIIVLNILPIFPLRKAHPSCAKEYNVLITSIISIFNPEVNCAKKDPF